MECSDSNVAQPMPQGDEKTPLSLSRSPPSRTAAFFCAYLMVPCGPGCLFLPPALDMMVWWGSLNMVRAIESGF